MELCEKTYTYIYIYIYIYIYQICHDRKKKLFGVRNKVLYYNVFHRKFISNRNDKKLKYV